MAKDFPSSSSAATTGNDKTSGKHSPRERTVLKMSEAGRLYGEIAEHIGISTTTLSRIYQLEQQGKQRLRKALAGRLAEIVAHSAAVTAAGG